MVSFLLSTSNIEGSTKSVSTNFRPIDIIVLPSPASPLLSPCCKHYYCFFLSSFIHHVVYFTIPQHHCHTVRPGTQSPMWKSLTSLYCVLLFLMGGILLFSPIVTVTAAPQPERDALSTRSKLSQILNNEKKKLLSFSSPQRNLCPYFSIPNIFNYMEKNSQNSNLDHVLRDAMITTPCFDSDSFGNTLSNYIEMRICSNITGYHFIGVSPEKGLASGSQSKPSLNPFSTLPEIVYNGDAGRKKSISEVMSICQCTSICHGE